jgi:hypothetical protein
VIAPDVHRCRGWRVRGAALCAGHSGRGLVRDPRGAQQRSAEARVRLSASRRLLGIGLDRIDPLGASRLAALRRAEAFARAIVDEPLDDPNLRSLDRQRAVIAAVELLFPEQTLEVQIPTTAEELDELDWTEL